MVTGKKLRYYREKNQLTQEQLAEKCHVSIPYISKIENNKTEPSETLLESICFQLNISTDELNKDLHSDKRSLLDEWYKAIKSRKAERSEELFSKAAECFKHVDEPQARIHYELISFRYFLFLKKRKEAAGKLQRLQKMEYYMVNDLSYYYLKFSGLNEYLFGNLEIALNYYTKAKALAEELNEVQPELLYQMALVYSRLQRNAQSIMHVQEALQAFSESMKYERCIDCNLLLGINFNILEDLDTAEKYFLKVIESADSHSRSDFIRSKSYHNLGHLYSKKTQHHQSIDCLLVSLEFKSENDKAQTYYLLANEYLQLDQKKDAIACVSKGLHYAEKYSDPRYKLKLRILEFQLLGKDQSEAFNEFLKEDALPFFRNRGDQFAYRCSELLGKYYAERSLYKDSTYYFQLTNELRKKYKR